MSEKGRESHILTRVNNPTQLDVSRMAGVSRSTVSMVLNGSPKICSATRERVLSIAKSMNYSLHENQAARRMAASRSGRVIPFHTIGMVWPKDFAMHKIPFYQTLFEGVCEGCWDAEYSLMLLNVRPAQAEQLAGLSQVDALILPIPSDEHYEVLRNLNIPLITTYFERSGVAHIGIDHSKAIKIAFDYLYENGHRKIGFISPALDKSRSALLRWKAYCELLQDAGLGYNPDYVRVESQYENAEQAEHSFSDIWEKGERPTAIIFHNDLMALSALRATDNNGVRVPEDVSFISIDNSPDSEKSDPLLTTVSINIKEMGRNAVVLAVDFIKNSTYYPEFIEIPLKLVIRDSVKKL
jgi:LacI family transcriptional regulator